MLYSIFLKGKFKERRKTNMNFKEAYEEFKKGKKIRRKEWAEGVFYNDHDSIVTIKDAIANDWEVVEKNKVWKPKKNERYYFIHDNNSFIVDDTNDNTDIDNNRFAIGNCFKTKEEAQHMVEKLKVIRELKDFALENNEEEIDWSDDYQPKFSISCKKTNSKLIISARNLVKNSPFDICFTSVELARKAIETIGEDRIKKYYFDIEEGK